MEIESNIVDAVLASIIRINFTKRGHFMTIAELKHQTHFEFVAKMNEDDVAKSIEILSSRCFLEVRKIDGVLKDFAIFCHHVKDM